MAALTATPNPNSRPGTVGSYHIPCLCYPSVGLGFYNRKVGYPKKGVWYEPTGKPEVSNLLSALAGHDFDRRYPHFAARDGNILDDFSEPYLDPKST